MMQKIAFFSLILVSIQAYGKIIYIQDANRISPDIAEQLEVVEEAKYNIKQEERVIEKAQEAAVSAKDALAKAEIDIQNNSLNKEKAEAAKIAAELAKQKAEDDIAAAEYELQQAKAEVPANGICTPAIYPYGSCYEFMRHNHNWYYRHLGKDEDILSNHCNYYFAQSRVTLEGIIARGCKEGAARGSDGCSAMAQYSLQARIDEERYTKCQRNKGIIQRAGTSIPAFEAVKQKSIEIIENELKVIEEAVKNIDIAKAAKRGCGINISEAEAIIKTANFNIEEAKQRIETAGNCLKEFHGGNEEL